MLGQHSNQRRVAPLSLLLLGTVVLVVALVAQRASGTSGSPAGGSGPAGPSEPAAIGGASASPGGGAPGSARALPAGLEDRGWVAEVGVQRWAAGSLSGRTLALPPDEIALTANATQVVSVRYGGNGRTSTVRVRDLAGGRLRVSVDRPGTVSSAVLVNGTAYVAGDTGDGASDAGVQAISLADAGVTDVIPPGPAPSDLTGPVTRAQLRVDPAGRLLGSALCSGETCSVDVVDLASGGRTTPVRNAHGFLAALAAGSLYLTDPNATSLDAIDAATGEVTWHLGDVQIGGVLPLTDGARVLVSYLPVGGGSGMTFTLAALDARSGARQILLQRATDSDVPTFYPGLSGDRFAVIGTGGTLGDLLGGGRRRAPLTLVDARTGGTQVDAVTITAP